MEESKKPQCRYLRSKMAHVINAVEPDGWCSDDKTTSTFWCLRTMQTAGPDNDVVSPGKCQPDRHCYSSVEFT